MRTITTTHRIRHGRIIPLLGVVLVSMIMGCNKEVVVEPSTPGTQENKADTLRFKTSSWQVYPYSGDGGDSMYFSWSPDLSQLLPSYSYRKIKSVIITTPTGEIKTAIDLAVTYRAGHFAYQSGEGLAKPNNVLLWWIQEIPGSQPESDSVMISLSR